MFDNRNGHNSIAMSHLISSAPVVSRSAIKGARPKAAYMLGSESYDMIYPTEVRLALGQLLDIVDLKYFTNKEGGDLPRLDEIEVLLSGWNMKLMDQEFLDSMPNLKVVFYGAGSIRYIATPEFWKRNIQISSSYATNAVPVAEFTMSAILLSLKHFWKFSRMVKSGEGWGDHTRPVPGAFYSKVGVVSCGMTARKTMELLQPFDLDLEVYCPFLTASEADELGVARASLKDIFRNNDVVTLHTPNLPETFGLIGREYFELMPEGATFINTARGQIVREDEMIEVARERPDLSFVLDVTHPEPPVKDSPLLSLPNVVLTPHIAGSMGPEVGRMGASVVSEVKRYLAGKPLKWAVSEELSKRMA
ncbi:MAG: hydroxyacid dehydrogenase [Lentimonas sp.]